MRLLISRHLENFLALYEARNMHVAAERKGITQPALTKSLRTLENEVGNDLFKRTGKGLEPTEAGTALFRHARAIDQEARFAGFDVQRSSFEAKGLLRVGVGPALAVSTFPSVLVEFHRVFANVQVTVETGVTTRLVDLLIGGDLDVAVSARPERELPELFTAVDLFSNRMVAICRCDHPLRQQPSVTLEQLAGYRRVGFLDDHDFDAHARKLRGRRAEGMPAAMRMNSTAIMFEVLAATDYFAIVNEVMLPSARREGLAYLPIADPLWDINIQLVCRLAFVDSRPVRTLLAAWRERGLPPQSR